MEDPIAITKLNDFIFCPASIYFHGLFGDFLQVMYQSEKQINGKAAHTSIDTGGYSTSKNILQGISVYSEQFGLYGKIDLYDCVTKTLTERKKKIIKNETNSPSFYLNTGTGFNILFLKSKTVKKY